MAFQRDYVLRLIEMMGEFFRRLCDLADEKEKMQNLNAMAREQCGLSLDAAFSLQEEMLADLLPPQGLFILSELTYLQAQFTGKNPEKRELLLLRALRILCYLSNEEPICIERSSRLKTLMDACADSLMPEDYMRCARFFMAGEHFDHGEDAIFLAVEQSDHPDDWIFQGLSLLRGLLCLPDSVLIPGGLPRADVFRAIDDLEAWEST